MILGEAPGEEEVRRGVPFCGASGAELDKMLHEAGFLRSQCFVTNVCTERPPGNDISLWVKHTKRYPSEPGNWQQVNGKWMLPQVAAGLQRLEKEIALCRPTLIIPLGNLALWATTGKWGITDWRGSQMKHSTGAWVVPTYHPAAILRQWDWRFSAVHDLRRAKRTLDDNPSPPDYKFLVRPSFPAVMATLQSLREKCDVGPTVLSVDIETRWGHIACLGIGWSRLEAFCIPFMCIERRDGYWTLEEETAIVFSLYQLLTHRNARCVGQNFLYDVQYILRHFHFIPRFHRDTMLGHHLCFPGLPKGLDFLSAMYCNFHLFWKAESKEWHQTMAEDILWVYNCKDCVITFECDEEIWSSIETLGMQEQHADQMALFHCALEAMVRGIRINHGNRERLQRELFDALAEREAWITSVVGHPLNIRSPQQMKRFFYEDLAQRPVIHRKSKQPTLDDDALDTLMKREPLLVPLIERIREMRSIGVFLSTFVNARPDLDGRMRSSFNPAGTETFRFSSSTNAFGSGMNLQNIPKGDDE